MENFKLTEDELASFYKNGFFGPFKVFEKDEALEKWKKIRKSLMLEKSKVYEINKFHYDRHLDIDLISENITNPKIIHKLQSIMGPDILCWRTEVFSKAPGAKGTEWHQVEDFSYANNNSPQLIPTVKTRWGIVLTVWIAFSKTTKENGCMKFLPGSHEKMYFDESKKFEKKIDMETTGFYGYEFADLKYDPSWRPDEEAAVLMEMEPGEAVIFTTKCVHGSTPNITKDSTRYSTNIRYVSCSTKIFPGLTEVCDHGEKYDLEKYRSVLVSGQDNYGFNRLTTENLNGRKFDVSEVVINHPA
ncbi:chlorinating enzyme [Puia dinghuensis]|uniref:Non-ribosomal peptide synthase n=1 Tax=Puia dinghuensis TaxID=1792502 RepID=A0A8J2XPG8_9BACT|nr:chlorinating enzyme [Puia dinghuensis]GGA81140.1 non-ribosomal peptide synthase [Puia dinghuensis]